LINESPTRWACLARRVRDGDWNGAVADPTVLLRERIDGRIGQ
jgi:hypothetical protein